MKFFWREKPIQVSWNHIGLLLTWSKGSQRVLGSLKRSTKFCSWILFRGCSHFCLQHLCNIDCIFGCCSLKFPTPGSTSAKWDNDPFFSIHITKHHKNLDSTLFMSEVLAHHTAITLISPPLKTVQKQSIGKHHVHLLRKRCKVHFFELKLESNITFFLGRGMSQALVDAKFYDRSTRNYASFKQ